MHFKNMNSAFALMNLFLLAIVVLSVFGNPKKPTVTLDHGTINQFVSNAEVNLNCTTDEYLTNVEFNWTRNKQALPENDPIRKPSENKYTLKIQGDPDKVKGNYSCIVNDTTPTAKSVSDSSDEVEIVPVNDANLRKPTVEIIPATGLPSDVECTGIPYGATYKFRLDNSTDRLDEKNVILYSSNKEIKCVLNIPGVTSKNLESDPKPLHLRGPTVSPSSASVSLGSSLNLTCNVADEGDQISWFKNKNITGETDRIFQIPNFQSTDAGIYVCNATNGFYNLSSNEADIKLSHAPGLPAFGSAVTVLVAVLSWRLF